MATRTNPRTKAPVVSSRLSLAALWLVGGALWLVAGLVDGGSLEALWILADLVLLAALVRCWQAGPGSAWRPSPGATAGLAVAIGGRIVFVAAEVVSAATGQDENLLLPLGALLTAVGMLVLGTTVARDRRWPTPARFAPLVMGLYPFVAMFPVVAATGSPSVLAIALWGLPTLLVGAGLLAVVPGRAART